MLAGSNAPQDSVRKLASHACSALCAACPSIPCCAVQHDVTLSTSKVHAGSAEASACHCCLKLRMWRIMGRSRLL